ncbi:response regulator [Anaeromyxobacter diazotrophicus]|uniref:Response regulatory domain-containing protein n=1 Tax=Anaeromyxobacter diazotrophicus TaxID=2590199 RepID=A0A7I9VGL6_9BACT|nr:response regulator [Anaeromyxobacter diazotrophicus]GEJ55280.1 hypothetical protein AMYX_00210 [Anaeromyxobacter diazotrophicus]
MPTVWTVEPEERVMWNGYRLLVVEDDLELCESIAEVLRLTGYEVETALDAETALAMLRGAPAPDAIVLDLVLPTMSASELVAALDRAPALVLMSGLAQPRASAFPPGDVLLKPFGAEQLLSRVARACGHLGGEDAAAP